jgi:mono/diheme cytochrome c family protein
MNLKFLNIIALFFLLFTSCNKGEKVENVEKGAEIYNMHCARCHIAPDINDLPKEYWVKYILPEMAARMGIKDGDFKPYEGMQYDEMEIIHNSGIYPYMPILNEQDWATLKAYILNIAPDSLRPVQHQGSLKKQMRFKAKSFAIDDTPGSYFTFLKYVEKGNKIWTGDISGKVLEHELGSGKTSTLHQVDNAVVDYIEKDTVSYITDIGILDPSELSTGKIVASFKDGYVNIPDTLHRPVNNLVIDLNGDGIEEMVVSEFGHLTGQLSLLSMNENGQYVKSTLLYQPGTIRSVAKDMDKDGKLDIVAITSQGDESITILYQQDDLKFRSDKTIRFSPIYGSSWFELLDYDGDGDDDIITVNGDNADKTRIPKPYHGLRIHLNDGNNQFTESFFYPLNGATRFVSDDFDQDGDIDFAIISTFPDYEKYPDYSLVYLENLNAASYEFQTYSFDEANLSRWFLLDTGDVDMDGDTDIILSAFTYVFVPVPPALTAAWGENNADIMVLENNLYNQDQ